MTLMNFSIGIVLLLPGYQIGRFPVHVREVRRQQPIRSLIGGAPRTDGALCGVHRENCGLPMRRCGSAAFETVPNPVKSG